MDKREFWSTKNPGARWQTITFAHAAFAAPIRLVANVFQNVTLGGHVYRAVQMEITTPSKKGDTSVRLRISFARPVVGREFKQQLALVKASGSRAPITCEYGYWLTETDAPKVVWPAYVADEGGVNFSADLVQVNATIDNPMLRHTAPIYLPEVFTGLAAL